jgi:hypothetical protein
MTVYIHTVHKITELSHLQNRVITGDNYYPILSLSTQQLVDVELDSCSDVFVILILIFRDADHSRKSLFGYLIATFGMFHGTSYIRKL